MSTGLWKLILKRKMVCHLWLQFYTQVVQLFLYFLIFLKREKETVMEVWGRKEPFQICLFSSFLQFLNNFLAEHAKSLRWGSLDNTATEILPFRKEEQSLEQLWVRSFAGDSATQLSKRIKFKGSSASCCSRYGTYFAGYVTWKARLPPALKAPAGQCVTQPSVAM